MHFQPTHFPFGTQKRVYYRGQFVIWLGVLIIMFNLIILQCINLFKVERKRQSISETSDETAAQFHTCNKASRDHQVVSLEELEANPQLASVSLICLKHNDEFQFLMRNVVMPFVGNVSLLNSLVTCVYHLLRLPQSMEMK